jgi:hypothetical protein
MSNYTVYGVDDENQRITVTDDLAANITVLELSTIELGQLADVDLNNLQASQVIGYNAIAGRWQNIDQGAQTAGTTPVVSIVTAQKQLGPSQFTVTNFAGYTLPTFKFDIKNSSGVVVLTQDDVTHTGSGVFEFSNASLTPGNFTLETTAQDFGNAPSLKVTNSFTLSAMSFRYWRIDGFDGDIDGTLVMIPGIRFYSDPGQTGTQYPPNMTSNTLPSPYVASGQGSFDNNAYAYWKVFDANPTATFYWNLSGNSATDHIDLDMGSTTTVKSMRFNNGSQIAYIFGSLRVSGSDTGAFSGEQTVIGTFTVPKVINGVGNVG